MESKKSDYKNTVAVVVTLLFLISLTLPAIIFSDNDFHRGFAVLIYGILGALAGDFAWFANPLFLAALVTFSARAFSVSGVMALMCVGLASTSFYAKAALVTFSTPATIKSLASGFYVWLASFVVLLIASVYFWIAARQRPR
jgi:hypothetical protein